MTSDSRDRPQRGVKSKPFPWRCMECGKREVVPARIPYTAEVKHDGTLYVIDIPELEIPVCTACGEKVFTNDVDDQISEALRAHLKLLTPQQIRDAIKSLGMSQKELAERMGVAEASLSRWINGILIQSRAMDNLMRVYFGSLHARRLLPGGRRDVDVDRGKLEGIQREKSAERCGHAGTLSEFEINEDQFPGVSETYNVQAVAALVREVSSSRQLLEVGA